MEEYPPLPKADSPRARIAIEPAPSTRSRIDSSESDKEQETLIILRSDRPVHAHFPSDDAAIGQLVRRIFEIGVGESLRRSELSVYLALATFANGKHYKATGELVAWPGEEALKSKAAVGRSMLYLSIDQLVSLGLVERVTIQLYKDRPPLPGYRIHEPSLNSGSDKPRRRPAKKKRRSKSNALDSKVQSIGRRRARQRTSKSKRSDQEVRPVGGMRARQRTDSSNPSDQLMLFHSIDIARASEPVKNEPLKEQHKDVTTEPARSDVVEARVRENAAKLISAGVETTKAQRMAAQFSAERIQDALRTLAWKSSRPSGVDNPGGFVCDFLEKNWPVPKGLADAAARQERLDRHDESQAAAKAAERDRESKIRNSQREELALLKSLDDTSLADAKTAAMADAPTPKAARTWEQVPIDQLRSGEAPPLLRAAVLAHLDKKRSS